MKVLELGHINLWVSDLERSSMFYGAVLGFREVARGALNGRRVAFFTLGARHHDLALVEIGSEAPRVRPPRPGMNHIGLKIGDGIDALRQMRGWLIAHEAGPHQTIEHCVCQSLLVCDPDGNLIELYADADPAIWADRPMAILCSKPLNLG